ncbi:MAG: hypothetical protein Q4G13_00635 [Moraxella sp.]|nr:hypothetical protein [Moraxella sp.]
MHLGRAEFLSPWIAGSLGGGMVLLTAKARYATDTKVYCNRFGGEITGCPKWVSLGNLGT